MEHFELKRMWKENKILTYKISRNITCNDEICLYLFINAFLNCFNKNLLFNYIHYFVNKKLIMILKTSFDKKILKTYPDISKWLREKNKLIR